MSRRAAQQSAANGAPQGAHEIFTTTGKTPYLLDNNQARSYDRRRADLIILLRTLATVGNTLQRGDSGGRFEPGSRTLEMPAAWHAGSYAALEEALRTLRKHGPRHHWNVEQRYISPQRTNRDLVYRPDASPALRYFEAIPKTIDGERHFYAGEALDIRISEVLNAKTEPRARVLRQSGDPRKQVLVRAIVERWDPGVERRPLEVGIDFLLSQMPAFIRLPREVRDAA